MRHLVSAFILMLSAGLAAAQPAPPAPTPSGGDGPVVDPPPNPPPSPTPLKATPAPRPVMAERDPNAVPPEELVVGIGFGWSIPDNVETPNAVSVRVRFPSGLTLEPRLVAQSTSTTMDPGIPGVPSTTDKMTDLVLAALLRVPVIKQGHINLEFLGAAGVEQHKNDPDGPDNTNSTSTVFLGWGVGISYWLSRHWQLSASAENPFVTRTSTSMDIGAGMQSTNTTTKFGVVFDPTVTFMIHLYH
jgi:hypothetical protein